MEIDQITSPNAVQHPSQRQSDTLAPSQGHWRSFIIELVLDYDGWSAGWRRAWVIAIPEDIEVTTDRRGDRKEASFVDKRSARRNAPWMVLLIVPRPNRPCPCTCPSKPNFPMSGSKPVSDSDENDHVRPGDGSPSLSLHFVPPKFRLDDRLEHKGCTLGLLVTTISIMLESSASKSRSQMK